LRAPHGASAQQQQQALAEMAFAARLRESFHDNSMSITTAWPESSYTVVFQDSGIVELPESARASLARRVAEFIRDHYDGYAAVRRVNVRFATSRFTFPVQVVQGSQR
jgi:hypothetical protein